MKDVGPHDRAVFEERAVTLYHEAVERGGIRDNDPRLAPDAQEESGALILVELGLLVRDEASHTYLPTDPATVHSQIVGPMTQHGTDLISESARWAASLNALGRAWRQSPAAASVPFTELRGHAIDPFIVSAVAEAEVELLTAQPQTGRDAPSIAAAALRDTEALARGLKQRTLYQHSARHNNLTVKYVAAVTERGAEIRTLDEFFQRLIVIDRRLAIIPSASGTAGAIVIREPSVVAYLVDVFERYWARARPFTSNDPTKVRGLHAEQHAEQRAMTIRMLVQGYADVVAAKRVGVSPRTYAGYVADLKEEYGAQTRFQLGYAMGEAEAEEAAESEPEE